MPPPILAGCTESLASDAPDLRGTWRAHEVTIDGAEAGALVLRPVGMAGIEVTRRMVGAELEWRYGPSIVVRLRRV